MRATRSAFPARAWQPALLWAVWQVSVLLGAGQAPAGSGNLLRNADFQDDWITLLPENKTLHWCYFSDFTNRRDYNPDAWSCKGFWRWADPLAPRGNRRLILAGPRATLVQRVNWVTVHDARTVLSLADAGGFPAAKCQSSRKPLRLVRDLTFRVRVKGTAVPSGAGSVDLALCPPGKVSLADPMGSEVAPTASVSVPLPAGTFDWRWVEVRLAASAWRKAAPANGPDVPLPGTVRVAVRYQAGDGQVELGRAELTAPGPDSPNLLANGGFERAGKDGYPAGWNQPAKYGYFPPRNYYLFTTWHNASSPNRGPVGGDGLVARGGARSLRMIVAAGDEKSVSCRPITLNQAEPRLLEVAAWVKTDHLCSLHVDAMNEAGRRLDGFSFLQKAPVSIGTDRWRLIRQVFRPRRPVGSLTLMLCARGANGYTLDDTGLQPQNNVVGTVWWDDVRLHEPESTAAELARRGVRPPADRAPKAGPHLAELDLGERMLGENVLRGVVVSPGAAARVSLRWEFTSPSGKRSAFTGPAAPVPAGGRAAIDVPYVLTECCPAYREYRGTLSLLDAGGRAVGSTELWFATWPTPIDLELGALYLRPEQKQFVRMNLGLSSRAMAKLSVVRLELVRRATGKVLGTKRVAATPAALADQCRKIPRGLREDFANLLLSDLDVSPLPVQPFDRPERNGLVRAVAIDGEGKVLARAVSQPFCRQAHEAPQPPVRSVRIDRDNLLYVNGRPWMPWGAIYGHVPVYAGPARAEKGKVHDLHNLPGWSIYAGFTSAGYSRRNDFNCLRYVAGGVTKRAAIEKRWQKEKLYCSSAFVVPQVVFSLADLSAKAGGKEKLDAYLSFCRDAPMVVSVAPGVEEAFGTFHAAGAKQLAGLRRVVEHLRKRVGKPVMVGHGGYWNRFEFAKVPFFDLYDPETEPFFPANIHVDLMPLLAGKAKAMWLRPQMYEDVPYERWRFHTYVELMRGVRGWQFAHGPGDPSLFRGLHGEMEFMKPIAYSKDRGATVRIDPWIEHWSRRRGGKQYILAATTRGIARGRWRWEVSKAPAGRARVTTASADSPGLHSIQYLPDARSWPAGSTLRQWVRLDARDAPAGLAILAKTDGRWARGASWGKADLAGLRKDPKGAYRLLHGLYTHAHGFLGWDDKLVHRALGYLPAPAADMGAVPPAGTWVRLDVPLERIAPAGEILDGVGFLHRGGRAAWGRTSIVQPGGAETIVWGDSIELPPDRLARVRIAVDGLKAGTEIRVCFEDRTLTAGEGHFVDDFRGRDVYQRYGGGFGSGYGAAAVAVHLYEVPSP